MRETRTLDIKSYPADIEYHKLSPVDAEISRESEVPSSSSSRHLQEFHGCWLLLDGAFDRTEESRFVEELDRAVVKVSNRYDLLRCQVVDTKMFQGDAVSEAWRFSRRARSDLLELIAAHDKLTSFNLAASFESRLRSLSFFTSAGVGDMLLSLSNRQGSRDKPVNRDCDSFVRATHKFLLRSEDVVDVMCSIMPHLPIYVFKKNGDVFSNINSIYFDNEDLALYNAKCIKDAEGSNLYRLRWYDSDDRSLFAEKKVSKNHIAQTLGCKTRAAFDRSTLSDLLDNRSNALPKGFKEAIPDEQKVLQQFWEEVKSLKARPMLRTTCRRACFQIPSDPSVRITIDLDFEAVLEGMVGSNWQWSEKTPPFLGTPRESTRFPMAIMEVKLESKEFSARIPDWLDYIVKQRYAMRKLDISKYQFAAAVLFKNRISLFPGWFEECCEFSQAFSGTLASRTASFESEKPSQRSHEKNVTVRRIGPQITLKLEQVVLKWLAFSAVPLASTIFAARSFPRYVHYIFLSMTCLMVIYSVRRYLKRLEDLTTGTHLEPDKFGIVFAGVVLISYGIVFTTFIDLEGGLSLPSWQE